MLPEVDTYFATCEAADSFYEENTAALRKALGDTPTELENRIYGIQVDATEQIRAAKKNEAWRELRGADDKVVAWIARKFRSEYRDRCEKVLEILPATTDQLEELRVAQGWCGDFTDYVDQAIADGALVVTGVAGIRKKLDRWVTQHVGFRYVAQMTQLLNEVVAAEVEAAKQAWEDDRALTEQATDAENAAHDAEQNL